MPGIDDVFERLAIDPAFTTRLGKDPRAALEAYDLSNDDLLLLESTLSIDAGDGGSMEQRTSKAGLLGLLTQFASVEGECIGGGGSTEAMAGGGGGDAEISLEKVDGGGSPGGGQDPCVVVGSGNGAAIEFEYSPLGPEESSPEFLAPQGKAGAAVDFFAPEATPDAAVDFFAPEGDGVVSVSNDDANANLSPKDSASNWDANFTPAGGSAAVSDDMMTPAGEAPPVPGAPSISEDVNGDIQKVAPVSDVPTDTAAIQDNGLIGGIGVDSGTATIQGNFSPSVNGDSDPAALVGLLSPSVNGDSDPAALVGLLSPSVNGDSDPAAIIGPDAPRD